MSYVTTALAREHCNLTAEVSEMLLQFYINAAEQRAAAFLNRPLSELLDPVAPPDVADPDPNAADAVRVAVLHYVEDFVVNKGNIVIGETTANMQVAENLLWPYRVGLGV